MLSETDKMWTESASLYWTEDILTSRVFKVILGSFDAFAIFSSTVAARAFVIRCLPSVRRPAIRRPVCYLRFLKNRCMDPGQILWESTYPTYAHIFKSFKFQSFTIFFSFSLSWDPTRGTVSKMLLRPQFQSIPTKLCNRYISQGERETMTFWRYAKD